MGMCCWMGSYFHDWIDYYGVVFLSYFEKSQWCELMYLCGFVSLWLCMLGCLLQEPIRLKVL